MNASSPPTLHYEIARWVLPIDQPAIALGFLQVENGHIAAVGPVSDLPDSIQATLAADIEAALRQNRLITPGLVNVHTHLEQSFGVQIPAETGSMADWLTAAKTLLSERLDTPYALPQAIASGIDELLKSGTTCVNDISRTELVLPALDKAGLRGIVSIEYFHPDWKTLDEAALEELIDKFKRLSQVYANHPRLAVGLAPHSPYNVSPRAWQYVQTACQAWLLAQPGSAAPVLTHTHLSESLDECAFVVGQPSGIQALHQQFLGQTYAPQETSASPIQYLEAFGLLDAQLLAVHGVFTDETDRALLEKRGVSLGHCPRSNLFLQQKTLSWPDWQDLDISVGLGTDGHFSTPTLDLRADARLARQLHGLSDADVLVRLTLGGAQAMKRKEAFGSLTAGKAADYVVWQPAANTTEIPPETQVLSEKTIAQKTMVAGQAVYVASSDEAILHAG